MSANADVLQRTELIGSRAQETALPEGGVVCDTGDWSPQAFAREQIRGLVQRVFFASGSRSVRQIVFSAVGPNTDVANICDQVGRALALETRAHIAIVSRELLTGQAVRAQPLAGLRTVAFFGISGRCRGSRGSGSARGGCRCAR